MRALCWVSWQSSRSGMRCAGRQEPTAAPSKTLAKTGEKLDEDPSGAERVEQNERSE